MKGDTPYGLIELVINLTISDILTIDFFRSLIIAAYQISLKIQFERHFTLPKCPFITKKMYLCDQVGAYNTSFV